MITLEFVEELIANPLGLEYTNKPAVLRLILQFIHEQERENPDLASNLMQKLITVEIHDPTMMRININTCLVLCRGQFAIEGKLLLSELWKRGFKSENWAQNALILMYFLDDFLLELGAEFVLSANLCIRIQELFHSKQGEDRKSANYLLRKLLDIKKSPNVGYGELINSALRDSAESLFSYETIMEWLDSSPEDDYWIFWIRKLSRNFVNKADNVVLFGTLEYFLDHLTLIELREMNLLMRFFEATNILEVHNLEDYFLPEEKMREFVADIKNEIFFEYFCGLSWNGVPMIRWLDCLRSSNQSIVDEVVLFTICVQVRNLKNPKLRKAGQNCIYRLFQKNIENMSLNEYLKFVETLFDNSKEVSSIVIDMLKSKIEYCTDITKDINFLNKKRFDFICGNEFTYDLEDLYFRLVEKFKLMQTTKHSWWRLPAFFCLYKTHNLDFYVTKYKVNLKCIEKYKHIQELQKYLVVQLRCDSPEEEEYVKRRCIDLFVQFRLTSWSQLQEFNLNPINILNCGTIFSYSHLAHLLGNFAQPIQKDVLKTFVEIWKQNTSVLCATEGILKYANRNLTDAEKELLAEEMILASKDSYRVSLGILHNTLKVSQSMLMQGILQGEATTGNERIENAYCIANWAVEYSTRPLYIKYVRSMSKLSIFRLFDELLERNCQLLESRMYQVNNSKEHRGVLRIVVAMLRVYARSVGFWSDHLWTSLMKPDNHMGISYFYECLVALHLQNITPLLDKIKNFSTLKSNQHDALVSVVHIYCLQNWQTITLKELKEIFHLLSRQTVHLNSQSMVLALLVLNKLAKKCEENSIDMPIAAATQTMLKLSGQNKLKYYMEARLMLPDILSLHKCCPANVICYMTNAPFDEYESPIWLSSKKKMSILNKIRKGFQSKPNEISVEFRKNLLKLDFLTT